MSPSELKVRSFLALAFLLAGLFVIRSKAAGLSNNGSINERQGSTIFRSVGASAQTARLVTTNPTQFSIVSGQDQIVMLFAPWDHISQGSAQLMKNFEEKYRGLVHFSYLDVSDPRNREALQKLNYLFYPQFVYLDGQGNILAQWTTPSEHEMTMAIEKSRLEVPRW